MKRILWILHCLFIGLAVQAKEAPISLAGEWRFAIADRPFPAHAETLSGKIHLPGTINEAGLGPSNQKPATLEGPYRKFDYAGPAFYQRDIEIPAAWDKKRITLFLERCRWVTQVWIDQQSAGTRDSLVAPHVYDFGTTLKPGRHRLTICVDNSVKLQLGRFVSALFGGTWGNMNGIIGRIELSATPPVWIDDIQVYPDLAKRVAVARVRIGNATGLPGQGSLQVGKVQQTISWGAEGGEATIAVDMSQAKWWDEFSPELHALTVRLGDDERTVHFGMREFSTQGTQFSLNHRTIYLRGTLECSVWPLTGYPPTDVPAWQRIYRIIKSYGLNHMRFHSWCPPDAAFTAADREGILLQVEAPQANVPVGVDPARDAFIEAELKRIVETYGNHPSFCLLAPGNEFGGKDEILQRWIEMLKHLDPRHLYSSAANAQKSESRQFTVTNGGRGILGPGTDRTLRDIVAKDTRPTIGHEIGQWMYYPNVDEIKKWTGVMTLRNIEMIRDRLAEQHQLALAPEYYRASGKFATLLYKEEIEMLLRTPGYGGFALLDLHDYPTQGTALVGPLDGFWDNKGFITPEEFRRFCASTVPLLRMPKRTYTRAERYRAMVDLAHYGPDDLGAVRLTWVIHDQKGKVVDQGALQPQHVSTGRLTSFGALNASLATAEVPGKLTVTVAAEGRPFVNDWDFWVYPAEASTRPATDAVTVCDRWEEAAAKLAGGRKVVLLAGKICSKSSMPSRYVPVFWSPIWLANQRPNTMGLLCDPAHPFFGRFPTETHTNWQWYHLMEHARLFILDQTPASYRPIVQVIDNFERSHRLGLVFEARVGEGKLLVCGIDPGAAPEDAAARQLFTSLYAYVDSPAFNPAQELSAGLLARLFDTPYAKVQADSHEAHGKRQTFVPENVLDGDPSTYWQSKSRTPAAPYPHELRLELKQAKKLAGLTYLPAPPPLWSGKGKRPVGWIREYVVYASDDGRNWGEPLCRGTFRDDADSQTISFPRTVTAKCIKLVAISGFDSADPIASIAETSLIEAR